jgi:hypothetical protein
MTTITDSTLPALRARFGRALASRLPEHIGRPPSKDARMRCSATVPSPSTRS